jgi:transcription termination/antitermination protein NusG
MDTELDPNEELLDELRYGSGQWYVIHAFSGHERRVKDNIQMAVENNDLTGDVYQVEVPMETVWEVQKGERKKVTRVKMPGYVLVRMELDAPKAWHVVKSTAGVTGFVGHGNTPVALSVEEVFNLLKRPDDWDTVKQEPAAPKVEAAAFHIGESVRVINGPFESLNATVADLNSVTERVTVMVELFGRDTPVELQFNQIAKL